MQGLLQRFENARAARELMIRNRLDAADHLAQDQHRRRHNDDAQRREHRVLHRHHRQQPNERKQIATEGSDEQVEHLARRRGSGVESRHELRAVAVGKKTDVMLQQSGKHLPLIVRR